LWLSCTSGRLDGLCDELAFRLCVVERPDFWGFPNGVLWVGFSSTAHALHPLNWGAELVLAQGFPSCTRTWHTLQGRVKNAR